MFSQKKNKGFFRTPVSDTFWRSPLKGLSAHAEMIKDCTEVLNEAVVAYANEDWDKMMERTKRASEIAGNSESAARSTSKVSVAPQMPVRRILALTEIATALSTSAAPSI